MKDTFVPTAPKRVTPSWLRVALPVSRGPIPWPRSVSWTNVCPTATDGGVESVISSRSSSHRLPARPTLLLVGLKVSSSISASSPTLDSPDDRYTHNTPVGGSPSCQAVFELSAESRVRRERQTQC